MSNYSAPITATGSLINFDAVQGGIFDSLSIPIAPTQDLHGYANPWPGGGGKNLFDKDNPSVLNAYIDTTKIVASSSYRTAYIPCAPNTTYTASKIAVASGSADRFVLAYTKELPKNNVAVYGRVAKNSGFVIGEKVSLTTITDSDAQYLVLWISRSTGTEYADSLPTTQIEIGPTATDYAPYSNICPITGLTGLSGYVSPTNQQAQATEYAISFGTTVYSGSVNPITGEVKSRPQYASYNGETLVGPWLSSLDEYTEGVTPTTGAQVVDLGGTETATSISPVAMTMLTGANYVWVSTAAVITLIYRIVQTNRQTGATSIGKNAESLLVSKQFGAYSKVVINVTAELYYESGNETGRTLTISCPWGTQAMADNILASLEGYQYQPYEAQNAILDPAAELGDGLTVNGVYGGIFKQTLRSGVLHSSDVSAPQDEEIDHEYKFTPASERKIERRINNMESELSVQADQISAKVDRHGGDPSSVSWTMDSDVFKVQADGNDVLTIDENGLTVNGNGNFTGEVQAKNIRYGGSSGTFSGGGISGGSIGTSKFTSGINTSLGNADYAADIFAGAAIARWLKCNNVEIPAGQSLKIYNAKIKLSTMNVMLADGTTKYVYYCNWG